MNTKSKTPREQRKRLLCGALKEKLLLSDDPLERMFLDLILTAVENESLGEHVSPFQEGLELVLKAEDALKGAIRKLLRANREVDTLMGGRFSDT